MQNIEKGITVNKMIKIYNVYEHDDQYMTSDKFEIEAKDLDHAIKQYMNLYGEIAKFFEVYPNDALESVLIYKGSEFFNNETNEIADPNCDYMNDGNHYEISNFATIERKENYD
ncbi:MAG: hypothetical protein K0S93_66 [Nitrososphaeraceae archaeon]|nr:hypothetical protein [Nitrososphaeraceae archaeon]